MDIDLKSHIRGGSDFDVQFPAELQVTDLLPRAIFDMRSGLRLAY